MKKIMLILSISVFFLFSACGDGGGSEEHNTYAPPTQTGPVRGLFTVWRYSTIFLSLENGVFDKQFRVNYYPQQTARDAVICDAFGFATGDESTGKITIKNSAADDPGFNNRCTSINGYYSYTNKNATLTLCKTVESGEACADYH